MWEQIERFYRELEPKGIITKRRQEQALDWLTDLVHDALRRSFYRDPKIKGLLPAIQADLMRGELTAVRAAKKLLALHEGKTEEEI